LEFQEFEAPEVLDNRHMKVVNDKGNTAEKFIAMLTTKKDEGGVHIYMKSIMWIWKMQRKKKLFLNLPSALYLYLLMLTSCNWMPSQFILTMASS
jgi:hypothetical protein